jgi:putative ABC transport system ATP-binding protein
LTPAPAALATAAVRATGLRTTYGRDETAVHALAGVDVAFATGEFTAIMGPWGSGKSTLRHPGRPRRSPVAAIAV